MRALIAVFALILLPITSPAAAQQVSAANVFISAEAAGDLIGKRGVTFLHVGTDEDAYASGHVRGARFLPLSSFTVTRDGLPAELPPAEELTSLFESNGVLGHGHVVLYHDPSGGDMEALAVARALFTLDALGHPHVNIIDGGLDALRTSGIELTTEASDVDQSELDLRSRASGVLVDADFVHNNGNSLMIVDARPPAHFSGDQGGEGVDRPGRIPGAVNLYWKDFLNDDGTLKPVADLARMWEDAGHAPGDDVVVYCRVGMQASYAYAVARHLGLDVRMYDGSYIDWSNNTEYPVVVGTP